VGANGRRSDGPSPGGTSCGTSWPTWLAPLFGGAGYVRHGEVERCRVLRIDGGNDEIMDEVIAKGLGL
jgi:alkylation response protein AidB-like acyl-CoA dehydrogenase